MKPALLLLIEFAAVLVAILFGVLWLRDPSGPYEPVIAMCGLIGTVLVDLIRRNSGERALRNPAAIVRVEAEARFALAGEESTPEAAWHALTSPFIERYNSWHPSYADFEPISIGKDGRPVEFETRGSSGGRYPWKIEEWNDAERTLGLWRGPAKSPSSGDKEIFLGRSLEFRVVSGVDAPFIDILYKERWVKKPWPTKAECFANGPKRELHWIFDRGFPLDGKIDYIRELDAPV